MNRRAFVGCLCLFALIHCAAPAAILYVAPNGNDAWSGKLAEPNAGKTDGPFASFARARDEIRKIKQAGALREAVTVRARGGLYFLPQTLVFEPLDSGAAQAPIAYEASAGEEPILSGGTLISNWREVTPGRWETQIPDVAAGKWQFSQLYVNEQRRFRPILPKEGYHFIAKQAPPTKGTEPDRFYFHPGDIHADWQSLGDVEVTTFHLWTMDRLRIKEVDAAKNLVTFRGPSHSHDQAPLTRATWYRAENVREALTQPGEWYLDRKTGVLTYLAKPGEDMKRARVIAPRLAQVVLFSGDLAGGAYVEHITLRGLTLAHNAWNTPERGYGFPQADVAIDAAVTARAARDCALERCVIRHTATYAVDWGDGCHGNRVVGCELFDLGAGGVKVGPIRLGDEPDKRKWSSGTIIRDNLIALRAHISRGGGRLDRPCLEQRHRA
ncbi:MAG: hypothetical protein NTX50_04975 [Candidatus Sumerlaeota bacterium]|nr:hypothetical protein [Candidatus Sumerlaeota bacterium]